MFAATFCSLRGLSMDSASRSSSSSETGTLRHIGVQRGQGDGISVLNTRTARTGAGHSPGTELPDHLAFCRRHHREANSRGNWFLDTETPTSFASQRCSSFRFGARAPHRGRSPVRVGASSVGLWVGSTARCWHVLHIAHPTRAGVLMHHQRIEEVKPTAVVACASVRRRCRR